VLCGWGAINLFAFGLVYAFSHLGALFCCDDLAFSA
jgi:hypothetical protein